MKSLDEVELTNYNKIIGPNFLTYLLVGDKRTSLAA
jgi:hypothetical protein